MEPPRYKESTLDRIVHFKLSHLMWRREKVARWRGSLINSGLEL
jgi:hypothetical protein